MNRGSLIRSRQFRPRHLIPPPAWIGHIPFAAWLVGQIRPRLLVELGTHSGNSYFAFCQAAEVHRVGTRCHAVDTWQGDEHAGRYDDRVFDAFRAIHDAEFAAFSTYHRTTFDDALGQFEDASIDLLHIDGLHTYEAVRHDFESWLPKLSERGVVLLHDTAVRARGFGVHRFWRELCDEHRLNLEFFHSHGLGVIQPKVSNDGEALDWLAPDFPDRQLLIDYFTAAGADLKTEFELYQRELELAKNAQKVEVRDKQITELRGWMRSLEQSLSERDAQIREHRRRGADLSRQIARTGNAFALAWMKADAVAARHLALLTGTPKRRRNEALAIHPMRALARRAPGLVRLASTVLGAVWWGVTLRLPGRLRLRRQARKITAAGLFDPAWYLEHHPDVVLRGDDPLLHFLDRGWRKGCQPNPLFDTAWYLEQHPESGKGKSNPLIHYLRSGAGPGFDPHPLFDGDWYLKTYAEVAAAGMNPLEHFLKWGAREGRSPGPLFDSGWYLSRYPEVRQSGAIPVIHYLTAGAWQGYDPNPRFDSARYLAEFPEVAKSGINPLVHFASIGAPEELLPRRFAGDASRLLPEAVATEESQDPNALFSEELDATRWPHAALDPRFLDDRLVDPQLYSGRGMFRISAIVPNYNHARYLRQRIESIAGQSYRVAEIIVLDDCSTDDSVAVIEKLREETGIPLRTIYNDRNSGSVFSQWKQGVEAGTGDLVWICESDDYCEPDFVERLVWSFLDPSVQIAFGRIQIVDEEGKISPFLDSYRESAEAGIWNHGLRRPACAWFMNGFGVRNVIANVGGCLWRRQRLPDAVWDEARSYRVAGDWHLYARIAGGGQIAYVPGAVSYFRVHGENTSSVAQRTPEFYGEVARVMEALKAQWPIPERTVSRFLDAVEGGFEHHKKNVADSLDSLIDRERLAALPREHPHILMAFLGFRMGGGEWLPIHLANALQAQGVTVSMFALDLAQVAPEMVSALDPAIPVYSKLDVPAEGIDHFLAQTGVSLIHSHMASAEQYFFVSEKMTANIPYLVSLHGSYEAMELTPEQVIDFGSNVSHWVYTAERNLDALAPLALPAARLSKMINGVPVDPRPYRQSREEMGIAPDAVVFTFVSRGIARKGWRASVEAFKRLRTRRPEAALHLLLVGEGEATERARALAQDERCISFLGYQDRIHGLYRISDVALAPTRFAGESFPLCLIQAMQTGTAILSTRVGEIEAMVERDGRSAGLLIDPVRDTEAFIESLTDAMEKMLDETLRHELGETALEFGAVYSIDKVAGQYRELYERLISGAGT